MTELKDEPFLRDASTLEAIDTLLEAHSLVVYCGAGVTRDRTGLGWAGMVSSVLQQGARRKGAPKNGDLATLRRAFDFSYDPKQLASATASFLGVAANNENRIIGPRLKRALYDQHGWSEGYLLRNIARLAIVYAAHGRDIVLATTNYDDYLDQEILARIQEQFEAPDPELPVPGLEIRVAGEAFTSILKPKNGAKAIRIDFLHGRVDRQGVVAGKLVFSEDSYSASRSKTVQTLTRHLNPNTAFLSLGASLDDEPLVEALVRAKNEGLSSYAIVHPPAIAGTEDDVWEMFAKMRGRHLGIEVLSPDGYHQTAQFIEELRLQFFIRANERSPASPTRGIASYASRLQGWWEEWSASETRADHARHFEILLAAKDGLRAELESWGVETTNDTLRVEVWVRMAPSVSLNSRALTLFANSTGVMHVEEDFRRESLSRASRVTAVRAFMDGRPQLLDLTDLGFADSDASRWKSFLAVPLYHEREILLSDGATAVGSVPVGSIVLASMLPTGRNGSSDAPVSSARSAFSSSVLSNLHYQEMINYLIGVGRQITVPQV